MADKKRGPVLTTFAVLFGLIAVSDLLKPLQLGGSQTGFVFFGQRLSGTPNMIIGPLFGLYLATYALAIWRMKRFAIPLAHAYALYVIINLFMFQESGLKPEGAGIGYAIFGAVYAVIAIGVSLGSAIVLTRRKEELS
jgi:hypothetical protein